MYELRVRRVRRSCAAEPAQVGGPFDLVPMFERLVDGEPRETFMCAHLDVRNHVLGIERVAIGCLTGVEVHPREVFRAAILTSAAAVVIAHNHPSGDPRPSHEDLALTQRLREVGELVGIPVLDHVILGDRRDYARYWSVAEKGWHTC